METNHHACILFTNGPRGLKKLTIFFFGLILNAYTFLFFFSSVGRQPTSHVGTRHYAADDNMGHSNPTNGNAESNQDRIESNQPEYMEMGEFQNVEFSDLHYQSLGTEHERSEPAAYAGLDVSDPPYQSLGTAHEGSEPAVYAGLDVSDLHSQSLGTAHDYQNQLSAQDLTSVTSIISHY